MPSTHDEHTVLFESEVHGKATPKPTAHVWQHDSTVGSELIGAQRKGLQFKTNSFELSNSIP
uniref:Uncharacterized protein n=1 Tax=Romanomermis culicivorax TaxID=13658 RepID=A0A915KE24_ROMCU